MRANVYSLLARFLARPPGAALLSEAGQWSGDDTEVGRAISLLAKKARSGDPAALKEEYEALFIGLGRGELVPYASYYLTGFLHEKPLARVRQDLREIGAERDPSVKEPEDHIAALLDVMVGLILEKFPGSGVETQRKFFRDHINSWAPYFFKDLEKAKAGDLYLPLGTIGRLFLEIEETAFEMA
ncbi:MAG: TorD/DmsD family molecular chaperone [Propylenella sp.]